MSSVVSSFGRRSLPPRPRAVGTVSYEGGAAGAAALGAFGLVAIGLTAGVGAAIGMGVAAAVSGDKKPAYGKGAAIGAGAGLLASVVL